MVMRYNSVGIPAPHPGTLILNLSTWNCEFLQDTAVGETGAPRTDTC
jgi:hypothetical protein